MARHPHLRLVREGADLVESGLTIDCDSCVKQHTEVCDDCVVSYLVGHEAGTPVVLDAGERRAVEVLAEAGLVPGSRFTPRPEIA